MLDDLELLRTNEPLSYLLAHYVRLAEPNREAWHPRLMTFDGVEGPELSRLHGLLIAMDLIELSVGDIAARYRATTGGLRAAGSEMAGDEASAAKEAARRKPTRRPRRTKKAGADAA